MKIRDLLQKIKKLISENFAQQMMVPDYIITRGEYLDETIATLDLVDNLGKKSGEQKFIATFSRNGQTEWSSVGIDP